MPFPAGSTAYTAYMCNGDGDPDDAGDVNQTRTHNKANEIEDTVNQTPDDISGTPDWVDPAYDLAGNMTAGPQPRYETADANTQLYKYDAWNRLTKIYRDDNCNDLIDDPSELVVTYSYDGQNRRIRKVVENGESDITYDYYYNENWQVLEVRKGGDTDPLEQYVWGLQYIDAPVVRFQDSDTNGTLNNTLYYTYDAQFNVTALIEPDGDVVERYVYDPYGQVTIYNGTWSSTRASSSFDNCIMYCGYWFDKESGNYIARRRYLTPPLGRWLTTDPIVHGDGMNWYQYVGGRPTIAGDPEGLKKWAPVRKYGQVRSDNYEDEGLLSFFRHWVLAVPLDDKLLIRNDVEGNACYGLWNDLFAAGTRVTILILCDEDGDIDFDPGMDMPLSVTTGNATVVVALDPAINGHKLSIRVAAGGAYKGTGGPTVGVAPGGIEVAVTWPGATYQHSSPTWLFKYECVCIEE